MATMLDPGTGCRDLTHWDENVAAADDPPVEWVCHVLRFRQALANIEWGTGGRRSTMAISVIRLRHEDRQVK